jgi:hypothetical protein
MTELVEEQCPQLSVYLPKNILIEGNKDGFNSKMAIEKFKTCVKKMDQESAKLNLEELQNKYIKSEFKLELVKYDHNEKNVVFKILLNEKPVENKADTKQLLKEKLKSMKKNRTNSDFHRARQDENVTDEILREYQNLKRMTKMPVPEPSEILSNPDQFRPLLNMVLNNQMVNQMGANHPYIKYFRLISEKLNLQPTTQEETQPALETPLTTPAPNKISSKDDDTDEED